jgi:hypothetical protein
MKLITVSIYLGAVKVALGLIRSSGGIGLSRVSATARISSASAALMRPLWAIQVSHGFTEQAWFCRGSEKLA